MNSKIIICKNIKIDREYINVLSYNEEQMLSLCNANKVAESNNFSFINRNKVIRVPFDYSDLATANYIAFQNPDYSNKWFFAFIDNINFRGNLNTEIEFTIDSWSTWFGYWQQKPCYVLRHHVNDDTIGLNTVPENLDIGEVIEEGNAEDSAYSEYFWVGVLTSHNPLNNKNFPAPITIYNGNVLPKTLCLFDASDYENLVNLGIFLLGTNHDNHTADIDSIFFIPDILINRAKIILNQGTVLGQNLTFYTLGQTQNIKTFNTNINKHYSFTGFSPKNNKCYCYPYNYLFVTNNVGNNNIFRYEDFSTTNCVFKNEITMSVGISGRIVPLNYRGIKRNDDEIVPLAKYPTLAWSSDTYTNWLTSQAVNIPTQLATSLIPSVSTTKEKKTLVDFSGNAVSVAGNIASTIGGFFTASMLPQVTHGQNTADINFLAKRNTFTFRFMRAKNEYLRIIDDYFTRFGYAINRVVIPNINGRRYWNYVEIGASEVIGFGDVPTNFMNDINKAFRRGVTIWHNHDNICDYNLTNSIV